MCVIALVCVGVNVGACAFILRSEEGGWNTIVPGVRMVFWSYAFER